MIIKKENSLELMHAISEIALNKKTYKELGYPIYTDNNHIWFLYYHNHNLIGLCAAIIKNNHISFNHDYIIDSQRNKGFYDLLFKERFINFNSSKIKSVATIKSINTFLRYGFNIKKQTKNYFFVEYGFSN